MDNKYNNYIFNDEEEKACDIPAGNNFTGFGTFSTKTYKYRGQMIDGLPRGRGIVMKKEQTLTGEFDENGVDGTFISDDRKCIGRVENGEFVSSYVSISQEGQKVVLSDGVMGYISMNGYEYTGNTLNGKVEGSGTVVDSDGILYFILLLDNIFVNWQQVIDGTNVLKLFPPKNKAVLIMDNKIFTFKKGTLYNFCNDIIAITKGNAFVIKTKNEKDMKAVEVFCRLKQKINSMYSDFIQKL